MSWIGRKIYEYLKECEEFKKEMNSGYQQNDRLDTSNPPIKEDCAYENNFELPFFKHTPPAPEPPSVDELRSNAKGCVPKTECLQPAPKQNGDSGIFVWFDEKGIKHSFDLNKELVDLGIAPPPAPERVPFKNFKNKRKNMKKEVIHEETCIITSVENNGVVSITIEPKKGFGVCDVSLNVGTAEILKEPVLPKELLNPKPELQAQYDTLAKLIATRDYYNGGTVLRNSDMVAVIKVRKDVCGMIPDIIGLDGMERFDVAKSKLYFKNIKTATKFLENFRNQIESVKHLI